MATKKTGSRTGRKRHSPTTRKPATIDLEPNEVTSKPSEEGGTEGVAPKTSGKAETSAGGGAAAAGPAAKLGDAKPTDATAADAKADGAGTAASQTSPGPSATQAASATASETKADAKPDNKTAEEKATGAKPADGKGGFVPKVPADKPTQSGLTPGRSGSAPRTGAAATTVSGAAPTGAAASKASDAKQTSAKAATDASASGGTAGADKTGKASQTADVAGTGATTKASATTTAAVATDATTKPGAASGADAKRPAPATSGSPKGSDGASASQATSSDKSSGASRGPGFGALLAASVVGGAITLGGAWALGAFDDQAGTLRDETATLRSDLDRRITAVESAERPEAITQAQVDEAIRAALEAERANGGAPDEATAARLTELENQLATARASLATLEDEPAVPDSSEALDQARAVIATLETRVNELGQRLDATENSGTSGLTLERATALTGEAVNPVREQVAGLAERVETLSGTVTERGQALAETRATLDEVQSTLTQLREGQEALGTRLEERIAAAATPLRERLDKLDATTNNIRSDLDSGLKAAEERSATLRTDLEGAVNELRQGVSDLDGKVTSTAEELRGNIDTTRSELTARLDERAATTDERLEVIEADIADTGPEERAAAALALANLRTRLDAGEPYQTELELVRDTQAQADLEPLRPYATEGIATLPQLRESFDEAADQILAATRPEADGAVGGFAANLRDLVRVRRAGDSSDGDSPRAIIADIRGALADGDLAAADQAWQRLPTAGKNASSNWHGRLLARIQAGTILPAAVSRLIRDAG